jgi:glyoxylase-like metal-dependent hydrolase (beta-lactamase superfamily II)
MMAPRFLNSALVATPERFVLRGGSWQRIDVGVLYGLVFHPQHGPVLIDTGYGPRATEGERSPMLQLYGAALRPRLQREQLPIPQLAARGAAPGDVRRIIVTHFHPDHIAALRDFPNAEFVTSGAAWARVQAMSAMERVHNGIFLELLPDNFGARIIPLEACAEVATPFGPSRDVLGDGGCLAIDLPGHAIGHFGLLWPDLDRPLFYAVDTTWLIDALDRLPNGPAQMIYSDAAAMRRSAELVLGARDAGWQIVLCHDRVD